MGGIGTLGLAQQEGSEMRLEAIPQGGFVCKTGAYEAVVPGGRPVHFGIQVANSLCTGQVGTCQQVKDTRQAEGRRERRKCLRAGSKQQRLAARDSKCRKARFGGPGRSRTYYLALIRGTLWPSELQAQKKCRLAGFPVQRLDRWTGRADWLRTGFGAGRRPTGRSALTRGSLRRLVAPIGSRCRSSES